MTKLSDRFSGLTPLQRAVFALKEKTARVEALERAANEPIAIVGIACRFPGGANDPASYWKLLCDKREAISNVPGDRWDADAFYDPNPQAPGKMNTRRGGFLEQVDLFDNEFFGVSEREACSIDPQQRLLLELAWEALEDAGIPPSSVRGSDAGVFIGICGSDYGLLLSSDLRMADAFVGTGSSLSIAANRLSFAFDLHGPSMAVDTACSSSLVATHLACRSLRSGESSVALVGGVNVILSPTYGVNITKVGFSSADGCVRAFDAAAAGFVRGEGAGIVVLKTLSKARADGDSIYAVIRGSAINEDGFSNGLTAPNRQSQEAVIRAACRQAQVVPNEVQYVECHGTGTLLGDTIEAMALSNVVGVGSGRSQPCLLSAVKTNLGHMEAAAGIASLIKAALALKHRQIPPTVHYEKPNPNIPFPSLGLQVATELTPWPEAATAVAGVSAFGFGGSNAHLILAEAATPDVNDQTPAGLRQPMLCLSARSPEALKTLAQTYRHFLADAAVELTDVCYAAGAKRDHHDQRLVLIPATREQTIKQLNAYIDDQSADGLHQGVKPYGRRPRTVFVFADDASAWSAFAPRFTAEVNVFGGRLREWDQRLQALTAFSPMAAIMAGATAKLALGHENKLLFALQAALADTLRDIGVAVDTVVGFGKGDLAAAYVARALEPEHAISIAAFRDESSTPTDATRDHMSKIRSASAALPFICASRGEVRNGRVLDVSYWQQGSLGALPDIAAVLKVLRDGLPDCLLEIGPASLARQLQPQFAALNPHGRVVALGADGSAVSFAETIAHLYVSGHALQWSRLQSAPQRRVSLPTYPWQRRRFWIKTALPQPPVENSTVADAVPTPTAAEIVPSAAPATVDGIRPRPNLSVPYEPPRTELEHLVVGRLQDILKIDRIGLCDNFFELGGESLQAATLINQIQKQLEETIHILAIFEAQTVAELSEYLRRHYPAAVKRLCPSEVVGETEFVDPDWPTSITDEEVSKARALVESYIVREEGKISPKRKKNPRAIFILSPPRCGTTLLRVMLAGNSKLFAPPELELLPFDDLGQRREAYAGMAGLWLEGTTRALMEALDCSNEEASTAMRKYETERMSTADLYRLMQEPIGDRILVDKTPSYASQIQILRRAEMIFDKPLYVHLLRHPCGMIRSFLDYKMDQTYRVRYSVKQKFPYSARQIAELVWTISHQNVLDFLSSIPASRHTRLSFEDLVRQPERSMQALSEFCEIPYDEAMADPYRDMHKRMVDATVSEGRMQGDQNFLVKHKKIDPSVADRWARVMTSEFLGAPTRELARELGYPDVDGSLAPNVPMPSLVTETELQAVDGVPDLLQQMNALSDTEVDSLLEKMLVEYQR
ncbi:MAG: sulfotransferase [Gammaproteobacteria bacterium]|nr:sulfotransferase [Gammaproteobacteria bacterium]